MHGKTLLYLNISANMTQVLHHKIPREKISNKKIRLPNRELYCQHLGENNTMHKNMQKNRKILLEVLYPKPQRYSFLWQPSREFSITLLETHCLRLLIIGHQLASVCTNKTCSGSGHFSETKFFPLRQNQW